MKKERESTDKKNLAESVIILYFMYYKNIKNVPPNVDGKGQAKKSKSKSQKRT